MIDLFLHSIIYLYVNDSMNLQWHGIMDLDLPLRINW